MVKELRAETFEMSQKNADLRQAEIGYVEKIAYQAQQLQTKASDFEKLSNTLKLQNE